LARPFVRLIDGVCFGPWVSPPDDIAFWPLRPWSASASVYHNAYFCSPGSIHDLTNRAYCLMDRCSLPVRRFGKRLFPDLGYKTYPGLNGYPCLVSQFELHGTARFLCTTAARSGTRPPAPASP
jgi:hypothetical protein